jgi:H+-transporting ATPase
MSTKGSDFNDAVYVEEGLSSEESKRRLQLYGYNEVPERKSNLAVNVARKFWGITPWMLEFTIILTWILRKFADTYIVAGLLVFNVSLSLFEERRAGSAISTLKQRLNINARVKRDGQWVMVPSRYIVPGDTIRLRAGDIVAADVRIAVGELEVDQSALTGESLAVSRHEGDTVYSGSTVKRGEATGAVTATGVKTYFGRTVELIQLAKPKLHMEEVTARVVRWLIAMVSSLLVLGIIVSVVRHVNLAQIVPLTVVLLVSAIPVALPSMFNISMALGSLELSKKGVLVTRLSASEDAATMDVLCTDKTGTLTKNKLSVTETVAYGSFGGTDVILMGALASNEANQDPIDLAFLNSAKEKSVSFTPYSQLEFTPFDPSTRMTQALVSSQEGRFRVAKGAVSAILQLCPDAQMIATEVTEVVNEYTKKGYRVLAVAKDAGDGKFSVVGIAALSDELREDSPRLVNELEELGVSVKMLTGDALPVAEEVARKLSLKGRIEKMSSLRDSGDRGERSRLVEETVGFAEIYPEDKYNIVKELQQTRHTVGMTGDGVNDAAALKQAEVGIAVKNATDAAKSAASAVLTIEGLEPIVEMVKVGRMVYQRVVTWIINKLVKTFQIVVFVVLAFLVTDSFAVSIFSMVLYLFLTDFVTLSISTDRVRYSQRPDTWDITWFVKLGVLIGILAVAETFGSFYLGLTLFRLNENLGRLHMYVFDYLVLSGLFNVLIIRERNHFWQSKPSVALVVVIALDSLLVAVISLIGVYNLAAVSAPQLALSFVWALTSSFVINDPVKTLVVKHLSR